jgi:hypothetical protein
VIVGGDEDTWAPEIEGGDESTYTPVEEPTPEPVVYDGCTNDDSVGDEYDDTCTEWYDTNPDTCGDYDTDTFVAADLCCACVGTEEPDAPVPEAPPAVVYDDCTNDDSVGDAYDDTCTEWYDQNPDTCGDYDTDTFVAADLCCACVGTGEVIVGGDEDTWAPVEEPASEPVVYDGCTNDDSVGDEYDDTCSEWYDTNPDTCGDYDTETFVAADLCCACVGTAEPDAPEPEAPPAVVYDDCTNDDSVGDAYDDTCSEWYDTNPDTCGDYDTDTFIAADLCCACVGTEAPVEEEPVVEEPVVEEPAAEEPAAVVYDGCTNDDSVGDEYDDTCTEWYDANPDTCGDYDTETFVAADLCCALRWYRRARCSRTRGSTCCCL